MWLWRHRKARRQSRELWEKQLKEAEGPLKTKSALLPKREKRREPQEEIFCLYLPTKTKMRNPFLDRLDPSKAVEYPGTKGVDGRGVQDA